MTSYIETKIRVLKSTFYLLVCLLIVFCSCNKEKEISLGNEGNLYMPQAFSNRSILTVNVQSEPQNYIFGAAYGGFNYFEKDVYVTFQEENDLIDQYNSENGTSYIALPSESYSFSSLTDTIMAGKTSSNGLILTIESSKLDIYTHGVKYLLPITLKSSTDGVLDSTYKTTYFRIDSLTQRERDITDQGSLSVNYENNGGPTASEGSPHLVDGDYSTKYLIQTYHSDMWVQLKFISATVLNAYTLTSGGDAAERDPKNWQLMGSNDGNTWVELDSQTGQSFSNRNETVRYGFNNSTAYTYYRLYITANNGDGLFQLSEWRVIQYY